MVIKNIVSVIVMKQLNTFFYINMLRVFRIVQIATGLTPPRSILRSTFAWKLVNKHRTKKRNLVLCGGGGPGKGVLWGGLFGAYVIIWCLSFFIYAGCFQRSILATVLISIAHEDKTETICSASKVLQIVALDIFAKNIWRNNNKLCF